MTQDAATLDKLSHDDPFWQRAVWSEMSSGARVIFHPPPLAIWGQPDLLLDFCTPLARITRFSGQGRCPFSVAFHTLVAHEIGRIKGFSKRTLLAILMHDLAEAITSDIPQPVKVYARLIAAEETFVGEKTSFSTALTRIEDLVEVAALRMLGRGQEPARGSWMPDADPAVERQVAIADAAALRVEAVLSMPSAGHGWPVEVDLSPAEQRQAIGFVEYLIGDGSHYRIAGTLHCELTKAYGEYCGGAS